MNSKVKIPIDINLHVSYLYLRNNHFVDTNVAYLSKTNNYNFNLYFSRNPKYMNYYFKIKKESRYNYILRAYPLEDIDEYMIHKPIIMNKDRIIPFLINGNGKSLHKKYINYVFNKKDNEDGTYTVFIYKKN